MTKQKDIYSLPSTILFLLGIYDLLRGFLHTFLLVWSAGFFAKLNLETVSPDTLMLLGSFGISNFLTGVIFILIALRDRKLAPYILIIIPTVYLLGAIGIKINGVEPEAEFNGRYFMLIYFAICIVTFAMFLIQKKKQYLSTKH